MRKFFLFIISGTLLLTMFMCGCGLEEIDREKELKAAFETTSEELQSNFSGSDGDYSLVSEYLESWSNNNEIKVKKRTDTYMILSNPATDGCSDSESTMLQCQVNTRDFSDSLQTLSTALTALLGPESHGDIALIITENEGGHLTGAADLDPEYTDYDNIINLEYDDESLLYTSGCYTSEGTMTSKISSSSPSYQNAYKITMTTTSYSDPFDYSSHFPNPIDTIGSLLATEKSSGQLFQLASFECDTEKGYTPQSATAVVVIDNNDVDSFTSRFNSSYEKVKKRFEKLEQNFVYTLTETDMPETVLSNESSDNIISLMYTLKTGIYQQDDESGEIIAASDISYVSTSDNMFRLKINSRSSDSAVLEEMKSVFQTTSGLCETDYSSTNAVTTWSSDSGKSLSSFFTEALGSDDYIQSSTLSSGECDIISSKADNLNIISYSFDTSHQESAMLNIIHFMESLVQQQ
ncbi:MAG: hypothetical protein PUF60_07385 [Firmicutes bacterium]|nr:hypothetical protein [Bacillota bacterium]